jgi:ankyrin repeat protein
MASGDPDVHEAAISAVHTGDLPALQRLLADHPALATTHLAGLQGRTLLHVATDWPGHFPGTADSISALIAAGADPNAPGPGEHPETPLHWAASSGDLSAINALLDHGADVNAPGAVIAGGTPMADATAFGQWDAARLLLQRGAETNLFESAALGLVDRVETHLSAGRSDADITSSFWGACHGGQIETAAVLLDHGAELNWVGYDGLTPLGAARRAGAAALVQWLEERGATSAQSG